MLAQAIKHKERLVVIDAGCASTIRVHHAANGVGMIVPVEHFAERAARELGRMKQVPGLGDGPVRYHDACQLGRGLGVYEQPRALLSLALGRAPDEFDRRREDARCSGAGGLLPVTMPEVSKTIAKAARRRARGERRRHRRDRMRLEPAHVPQAGRQGRRSRHRRRAGARCRLEATAESDGGR